MPGPSTTTTKIFKSFTEETLRNHDKYLAHFHCEHPKAHVSADPTGDPELVLGKLQPINGIFSGFSVI